MNAAQVATVHGDQQRLEPSDTWPYMRTSVPMVVSQSSASQLPRGGIQPMAPNVPFMTPGPTSLMSQVQGIPNAASMAAATAAQQSINRQIQAQAQGAAAHSSGGIRETVNSVTSSFNSEDAPKLILFAGAACGAVLLLDLAARFIVNMAQQKRKP